jgi:OOP family OmpA-OmpF porin
MRLSVSLVIGAVFSAAAAVCFAAAYLIVILIETATVRAIQNAHYQANQKWVKTKVSGLRITLHGTAPGEAAIFSAVNIASSLVSGSRISNDIIVAKIETLSPPAFSLMLLSNKTGLSLVGLVPKEADQSFILTGLRAQFAKLKITNLLEIADYPAPDGWQSAQEFAVKALGLMPKALISMTPQRIEIKSITQSDATKKSLETQLAGLRPNSLDLSLELTVPRPVIAPYTLHLSKDQNGTRLRKCSAQTPEAVATILTAAKAAGAPVTDLCKIGLGAPSPLWPEAVVAAITSLHSLKRADIILNDLTVRLHGTQQTDRDGFEAAKSALEIAMPQGYFLIADIPDQIDETDQNVPPVFIAIRSPEGMVQLRGQVAADLAYRTVKSYAEARFSADAVHMAAESAPQLGEAWSIRVFLALDALASTDKGIVRMTAQAFAISGTTGVAENPDQIKAMLRSALGPEATITVNVTYVEPVALEQLGPTPVDCEIAIARIIAEQKISFQPSSAKLEIDARQVIDKIAEILKDCGPIKLEVGGHTDSQGREEMNQTLSQNRAQSVLNALLSRRVSIATFSAKGYGEARPTAENTTEKGREANRRIEFRLRASDMRKRPPDPLDQKDLFE